MEMPTSVAPPSRASPATRVTRQTAPSTNAVR
jgi:hypothetical protein